MKLTVSDIQRFCMHDGDGLRTTVFLKGCPLRCEWCHNPETQKSGPQILFYRRRCINCGECTQCGRKAHRFDEIHEFRSSECIVCGKCASICPTKALEAVGQDIDADEIIDHIMQDFAFYGEEGGVTLSGGEPMAQAEGTVYLLKRLKELGINTALETSGYFDGRYLPELVEHTDMFLWDIKDTDSIRHRKYTGVSNEKILKNLFEADRLGAKTVLRCIIVNGVNTDKEHYSKIAEIFGELNHCRGVELLPYHTYGGTKYEAIYGVDNGKTEWIPSKEIITRAGDILKNNGVNVL